MGEVYQAHDERLDRHVALKFVRSDRADTPRSRERLIREARATARLRHPALVQVHDIVELAEGDCIVMELVEGNTLSSLIEGGPLSPAVAVRLAREVCEGLGAAHGQGILHRDLKAENVIVTPEGHAKILDFGLAKSLGSADGEPALSVEGALVGTTRAMSPEQARGDPLDARADLFSLGVMLYEMLTGRSPFLGTTAAQTLTRVCTYRQVPARELNPAVPSDLSKLVDRLLEKDPAHRPGTSNEVGRALRAIAAVMDTDVEASREARTLSSATTLGGRLVDAPFLTARVGRGRRAWVLTGSLVLAVGVTLAVFLTRPASGRLRVAVPGPAVAGAVGAVGPEVLASATRVALLRGLVGFDGVSPLAPSLVDPAPRAVAELARAVVADEVLVTSLECREVTCTAVLQRVSGTDARVLALETFEVPTDDLRLLATAAMAHLRLLFPERKQLDTTHLEVTSGDYARYLGAWRDFQSSQTPSEALIATLGEIRKSSPRFLETYILEADVLRMRFIELSRDRADLDRARSLLEQARLLAPRDPEPLLRLFGVALEAADFDVAEETLRQLAALEPGGVEILGLRGRLLERQGRVPEALALVERAARLQPTWKNLFNLANMESRRGRSASARAHLRELLQRVPDHVDATSLLAQLELVEGNLEDAALLYEQLSSRSAGVAELANLGGTYLMLARYPEASQHYRKALDLAPENPMLLLGLADASLLQGNKAEAEELYRQVLSHLGPDPAGAGASFLTLEAQARAHLGDRRRSVAAVQRALQLAPDNPQVLYEASLVYCMVGDLASAVVTAEKALEQGIGPRWFDLPWLEPLRSHPDLAARLHPRPGT